MLIIRTARFCKVCNLFTVHPLLVHIKFNDFELNYNRECLKQYVVTSVPFRLITKSCSKYLRNDYIDMFFHVKCLLICIPKDLTDFSVILSNMIYIFNIDFDTVIYLIFVIRLAKYNLFYSMTFLAQIQSYKCFYSWFML